MVTFVRSYTGSNAGASSVSCSSASSAGTPATGNLLIAFVAYRTVTGVTVAPAGNTGLAAWNSLSAVNNGTQGGHQIFYKLIPSTDVLNSNMAFNLGTSVKASVIVLEFSDVSATLASNTAGATQASNATHTGSAVTPVSGDYLIFFDHNATSDAATISSNASATPNTGWTNITGAASTGNSATTRNRTAVSYITGRSVSTTPSITWSAANVGTVQQLRIQNPFTPNAPTTTAATAVGSSGFFANWTAPSVDSTHDIPTGYRLDVATDVNFTSIVSGFNNLAVGNNLTYSVTGLTPGLQYWYRVRATNANTTPSANSNATSVTLGNTTFFSGALLSTASVLSSEGTLVGKATFVSEVASGVAAVGTSELQGKNIFGVEVSTGTAALEDSSVSGKTTIVGEVSSGSATIQDGTVTGGSAGFGGSLITEAAGSALGSIENGAITFGQALIGVVAESTGAVGDSAFNSGMKISAETSPATITSFDSTIKYGQKLLGEVSSVAVSFPNGGLSGSAGGGAFNPRYNFENNTVQGWAQDGNDGIVTASVITPGLNSTTYALQLATTGLTTGTTYQQVQAKSFSNSSSMSGDTIKMRVKQTAGTTGVWSAVMFWVINSDPWTTYFGTPVELTNSNTEYVLQDTFDPSPADGYLGTMAIQFFTDGTASSTATFVIDEIEQGSTAANNITFTTDVSSVTASSQNSVIRYGQKFVGAVGAGNASAANSMLLLSQVFLGALGSGTGSAANGTVTAGQTLPGAVQGSTALSFDSLIRFGQKIIAEVSSVTALSPLSAILSGESFFGAVGNATAASSSSTLQYVQKFLSALSSGTATSTNATIRAGELFLGALSSATASQYASTVMYAFKLFAETFGVGAGGPTAGLNSLNQTLYEGVLSAATGTSFNSAFVKAPRIFPATLMGASASSPTITIIDFNPLTVIVYPSTGDPLVVTVNPAISTGPLSVTVNPVPVGVPLTVTILPFAVDAFFSAATSSASATSFNVTYSTKSVKMDAAALLALSYFSPVTVNIIRNVILLAGEMVNTANSPNTVWFSGTGYTFGGATGSATASSNATDIDTVYTFLSQTLGATGRSWDAAVFSTYAQMVAQTIENTASMSEAVFTYGSNIGASVMNAVAEMPPYFSVFSGLMEAAAMTTSVAEMPIAYIVSRTYGSLAKAAHTMVATLIGIEAMYTTITQKGGEVYMALPPHTKPSLGSVRVIGDESIKTKVTMKEQ